MKLTAADDEAKKTPQSAMVGAYRPAEFVKELLSQVPDASTGPGGSGSVYGPLSPE